MRKALSLTFLAVLAILATGGITATEDSHTLNGEYRWNQGEQGPLKAVFTGTGDKTWSVSFYFKFNGQDHVYSGTAEGSLSEGSLEGEVKNEAKNRTFIFGGSFDEGKFSGKHSETTRNRERKTGTLTLS